jgi:hypothetical protein
MTTYSKYKAWMGFGIPRDDEDMELFDPTTITVGDGMKDDFGILVG